MQGSSSNAGSPFQNDPFLRVKAAKVTQLLDLVGELGLAAAGVLHHPALAGLEQSGFQNDTYRLETLIRDVQDLASSMRLVPVMQIFRRMQRTVHDLLDQTGKQADLVLEGEETELDKLLVDQLAEPLMHLLRNAVDHGLETPAERAAAGKPERGRITLRAAQQGREIHITVEDDGGGLNRNAILAKARAAGLVGAAEEPSDAEVWDFIFHAGFSTAAQISNLSGRGVGMDIVRNTIQALRGTIRVETWPGAGTRITLAIPLTLAFLDALVVQSGRRLYALPMEVVREVFQPDLEQVMRSSADGSELVNRQGTLIPVVRFARIFHEEAQARPLRDSIVIAVQTRQGAYGLPVDRILGQQQVIVKPLHGFLGQIHGSAGCALLGTGEVAIALDVDQLLANEGAA